MKFLSCCIGLLIIAAHTANAQEVSVPLDTTGKIFVITLELENKLGLFQDYPGFIEARLYQAGDNEYFLEILEQRDSSVVRKRVPQTAEQIAELRKQVTAAITLRSPEAMYNHDGRGGFLVNSAILALGFYGWAVPVAGGMDGTGAVSVYCLVGAAGVLIPYFATEKSDVTVSAGLMDFYGATRGAAHGLAIYYLFDPDNSSERAPVGWAAFFSVGERVVGYQWASHSKMSTGEAAVIGVGGDFGLGMSAFTSGAYGLWDGEHQSEAGALILGGSAIGIFAGKQLADHGNYTRGDAYVLRGLGILGAGIPAALTDGFNGEAETAATLASVGSVAALGLGHYILRNKDFSTSQGLSVIVAEIGAATLATALVITSSSDESSVYSLAAAAGGTLGFVLAYSQASKSARTIRRSSDLDFQFNPLPLLTEVRQTDNPERDHRAKQALSLTYRF